VNYSQKRPWLVYHIVLQCLSAPKRGVKRLRKAFADTRLICRGDSHHTKPPVMERLETHEVDFSIGEKTTRIIKFLKR
jgi:hypothetical protein